MAGLILGPRIYGPVEVFRIYSTGGPLAIPSMPQEGEVLAQPPGVYSARDGMNAPHVLLPIEEPPVATATSRPVVEEEEEKPASRGKK